MGHDQVELSAEVPVQMARSKKACLIFFDEVDAIGGARFDDGAGEAPLSQANAMTGLVMGFLQFIACTTEAVNEQSEWQAATMRCSGPCWRL